MSSQRYCDNCGRVTKFVLDKTINHSHCEVCFNRFGKKPKCKINPEIVKLINSSSTNVLKEYRRIIDNQIKKIT